jgi:hypothetical protein
MISFIFCNLSQRHTLKLPIFILRQLHMIRVPRICTMEVCILFIVRFVTTVLDKKLNFGRKLPESSTEKMLVLNLFYIDFKETHVVLKRKRRTFGIVCIINILEVSILKYPFFNNLQLPSSFSVHGRIFYSSKRLFDKIRLHKLW